MQVWHKFAWLLLGISTGLAIGVGAFTFVYAKGYSYLTNDPAACANCHIMNEQYDGWSRSSHRAAATCNDCHTPPEFFSKYVVKARNGFWHSFYFTSGGFHQPIQITAHNREVTERACRHCHQDIVQAIDQPHVASSEQSCIRCHNSVGHLH